MGKLMSTSTHFSEDKRENTYKALNSAGLSKKYNKYPFSPFICSFMLWILPYSELKHNVCMLSFNNHGDTIFKSV